LGAVVGLLSHFRANLFAEGSVGAEEVTWDSPTGQLMVFYSAQSATDPPPQQDPAKTHCSPMSEFGAAGLILCDRWPWGYFIRIEDHELQGLMVESSALRHPGSCFQPEHQTKPHLPR
jgi:hypothetical protein